MKTTLEDGGVVMLVRSVLVASVLAVNFYPGPAFAHEGHANGALTPRITTIDSGFFSTTYTNYGDATWEGANVTLPKYWWQGGGRYYAGWSFRDIDEDCGGFQVEVTRPGGQVVVFSGENVTRFKMFLGASRPPTHGFGPPNAEGQMTARLHCSTCPCFCATSTYTLDFVE